MEPLQSELGEIATEAVPTVAHQALAALADGDRVESCYAVRDRSRRPTKRGGEWLSLKIADRTATIQAKSWDEVEARFATAEPGTVVHIVGRFECSPQWGDALIVEAIAPAGEGDYDPANRASTSSHDFAWMVAVRSAIFRDSHSPPRFVGRRLRSRTA